METAVDSPLSTRELRNKYVRRPLRDNLQAMTPDNLDNPSRRRSSRLASPPNSNFMTSSPRDRVDKDEDEDDCMADKTPGMSMIEQKPKKATPKTATPNRSTRSSRSSSQDDEDEDTETSTNKSKWSRNRTSIMTTPTTSRHESVVSKKSLNLSDPESTTSYYLAFLVILGIVLGIYSGNYFGSKRVDSQEVDQGRQFPGSGEGTQKVTEEVNALKTKYPSQEAKLWHTAKASIKSIFTEKTPSQPAILLFVASQNSADVAKCLAKDFHNMTIHIIYDKPNSPKIHDGRSFANKEKLFDAMMDDLSVTSTFTMTNLQKLDGMTARGLHAPCDNVNAPHKRALVNFVVVAKDDSSQKPSLVAENTLMEAWKDLEEEQLLPVLARVAVSVVRVKEEENHSYKC